MTIRWPSGRDFAELKRQVSINKDKINKGRVLVIDPASVKVGFAILEQGEVVQAGTINLPRDVAINNRLRTLAKVLRSGGRFDIVAVERIRGRMAHEYLKWSIGAIISSTRAKVFIEIPIHAWKAYAGKEHSKSDVNDAMAMAGTLLELARE